MQHQSPFNYDSASRVNVVEADSLRTNMICDAAPKLDADEPIIVFVRGEPKRPTQPAQD